PDLVLAGGDVLLHDGGGAWRVERGDVVVREGRIAAVGKATEGRKDGTGKQRTSQVRDCTGCLVLPGLIQAHVHLCQTLFRGLADDLRLEDWLARRIWPLESAHTEETVYWSALLGAAELLLGGTTAILDMETVRHTGAAFAALERVGIRATAGKCLMDAHPEGAPLGLAESTDAALADAETLARRRHGAAGGRPAGALPPRPRPGRPGPRRPRGGRRGRGALQQPPGRVRRDAPRRPHPEATAGRRGAAGGPGARARHDRRRARPGARRRDRLDHRRQARRSRGAQSGRTASPPQYGGPGVRGRLLGPRERRARCVRGRPAGRAGARARHGASGGDRERGGPRRGRATARGAARVSPHRAAFGTLSG